MISTVFKFLSGDAVNTLAGLFKDYQDKKLTKEQLKFKLETFEEENTKQLKLAQVELNKIEANHSSVFVAGWRPFVGWVCGAGFAMNFLVAPFLTFTVGLFGSTVVFPQADLTTMMPVLIGMLGLGGYRMKEKLSDKARNKL